ncbi:MAG: DUF169 domain-containing protein [Candidatus Aminicenantes bacterium]|nr:DUF169 domain-containing protein [Candidatus Aminicenantes bacterium]
MDDIHLRFSDKFRSHWIKVKFYKEEMDFGNARRLKNVRFCEATKEAILQPVFLDEQSINCPGAGYAFGWKSKKELINWCLDKDHQQKDILKSLIPYIPYFKEPIKYIGLNTEGEPDLVMSYVLPECAMDLVRLHNNHSMKNLDVSLCSMMPICSGVAVRAYLEGKLTFSFGCEDSRKYAKIERDRLAVGIPNKLFSVFTD